MQDRAAKSTRRRVYGKVVTGKLQAIFVPSKALQLLAQPAVWEKPPPNGSECRDPFLPVFRMSGFDTAIRVEFRQHRTVTNRILRKDRQLRTFPKATRLSSQERMPISSTVLVAGTTPLVQCRPVTRHSNAGDHHSTWLPRRVTIQNVAFFPDACFFHATCLRGARTQEGRRGPPGSAASVRSVYGARTSMCSISSCGRPGYRSCHWSRLRSKRTASAWSNHSSCHRVRCQGRLRSGGR